MLRGDGIAFDPGRRAGAVVAAAMIAASATAAHGGEPAAPLPAISVAAGSSIDAAGKECYCRVDGRAFLVGEAACIRGTVATCTMFLNNPSWSMSQTPCPVSRLAPGTAPAG